MVGIAEKSFRHAGDRLTRRALIRLGAVGLGGRTPPGLWRLGRMARAGATGRAKSVTLLFLSGGPAHQDMWDLKPEAPEEVRGPFRPIETSVPGILVSEHLPRMARLA